MQRQLNPLSDKEMVAQVRHATMREREIMARRAAFRAMLLQDEELQNELAEVVFASEGPSHEPRP